MSDPVAGAPTPDGGPVAAARTAMEAAREATGAAITARAQALAEAARLRERSQAAGGLAELTSSADAHDARAAQLDARIDQLRDLAHRAEVAYEALRADRGDADDQPAPSAPAA